ncbi:MAG TPA: glycosyltransferase [Candidatus Portnoybacteria bacterium]|jgi:glycosyltransferase involved in cell wall biosynthesis|nr:glycosyltransferase [Candidatus Portnoybacteria bacterium]MDD5752226.1 glycosyltransferase [Candidatus Portnoybacteria bacterium]HNU96766.1 glycosyltransferase [Candidatus Portnoybacteria bacterium]HOZ16490.1 glycosyltransferase [Candidatus Portnoybacteria bacterium]HPH52250.1 glycosyltransferase [Candidatus Portnoybacteria bacterium]
MKIAIINEYLTSYGGAEKTFKVLADIFEDAELFTLFYDPKIKKQLLPIRRINASFLQKLPKFFKKHYQLLLPFLPIAAETIDLRDFDIVISTSHSFIKGIITRPKTTHICYCFSPTRYLWDKSRKNILLHYFRVWDRQASERVDKFIACSETVKQRIYKYYKRDSVVIYPPVQFPISNFQFPNKSQFSNDQFPNEFYLIVSQLRRYKRIDIAIEAFNKLGLPLIIIGDGSEKLNLQRMAKKNIKFLGFQSDEKVREYYQNCTAFIFPTEDDFGITPVEAMSYGKPVLAFRKGGATETVIEGKTGEFFDYQNPAILADGMRRLRLNLKNYNPQFIYEHAKQFSEERFKKEILKFISKFAKEG